MATKLKSVIYSEIERNVDETGVVLAESVKIVKKVTADQFMQVYLQDVSGLLSIDSAGEFKVLLWLWQNSKFYDPDTKSHAIESNKIILVKAVKEEIAAKLDISVSRVNGIIISLVKKNLLIIIGRSVYTLNAKYFFKGYSKHRESIVQAVIEYQVDNRNRTLDENDEEII